jgi:hypothetical protein
MQNGSQGPDVSGERIEQSHLETIPPGAAKCRQTPALLQPARA